MNPYRLLLVGVLSLTLFTGALFYTRTSAAAGCTGSLFISNLNVPSEAPASVVFADFNGDTKTDMAVANFGFGTVSIYLGNGSGGFGPQQTFPSAFGAQSIAVGDFNNDNKLDLAVADWFNHQVALSLGAGDGTFGAPARFAVGLGPSQIAAADFNGDNKLDFATANFFDNAVAVFLGDGSGGFVQATGSPFAAITGPRSLRIVDFNSDNKMDVAVAGDAGVRVFLGNGSGGLTPSGGTIVAGQAPNFVDTGDFNGDSKLDMAVSNNSSSNVSIFFGDGAGNFQLSDSVALGPAPRAIVVDDLNGDGKPDLASANFDANTVTVLLNDGAGALKAFKNFPVSTNPRALALTDLNGDGKRDLAVANSGSYTVSILMGTGGGDFSGPAIIPVFSNPAHSLAVADINADGRVDIAAGANGRTSILLGNGTGGFTRSADIGFGPAAFVQLLDLNGDGKLDVLSVEGASINTLSSMLGFGDGTFAPRRFFPVGTNPQAIATGDFNRDGKTDAAVANFVGGLSVLLGDGFGGFGPATTLPAAQTGFMASGDFNNDGKVDLVATRIFAGGLALMLGNGDGTFTTAPDSPFNAGADPHGIAVGDFNGDGDADLAITNEPNPVGSAVAILLGNGAGSFSAPTTFPVGAEPISVVSGDYNLDGKADLAVASRDANIVSVLMGNGDGTFGNTTTYGVGQSPVFVATGDFNGDGRSDLAAAINSGVAILPNTCTATAVSLPSVSVADVSVVEGDAGTVNAVFTLTLSAPSAVTVSVGFNAFAQTAALNADFQPVAGRVKFAPGVVTQTVTIPVVGDELDEFDETFGIDLSGGELNATISRARAQATIVDNDPPPSLAVSDLSIQEGNAGTTNANVTLTLSKPSGKSISLQYTTANGTAVAGSDYVAANGSLTFAPGETQKVASIQVIGDTIFEPSEKFVVNISNALNVTVGDPQVEVTIVNDEPLTLVLEESGPVPTQVAAFESVLFVRDPFRVPRISDWFDFGSDTNTRVIVFLANLQLGAGDSPSFVVNLVDSNNQSFDVPAEDVRVVPNTIFTQVIFRLPDNLASGTVQLKIKAHGQTSNTGTIRIAQ